MKRKKINQKKFHKERGSFFLRFLDYNVGIPLIFFLRIFKKKKQLDFPIKKIALLKTAGIGDTACLLATINDLKSSIKDVHITLFVGASNYPFAKLIEGIDVVSLPMRFPWKIYRIIRIYSFDIWFDFGCWPRIDALITYFSKSKSTFGIKTKRQWRHYLYDGYIERDNKNHEYIDQKRLLECLGIRTTSRPTLPRFHLKGKKQVILHMFPGGSRDYLKKWPTKNWIELISYLTKQDYRIFLTGAGAMQREKALEVQSICQDKNIHVVANKLSLKGVIRLIEESFATITVDTGIMHIASALQANLIALFGPTNPTRYGPINENAYVLKSDQHTPCIDLGFESKCKNNVCMQSISVDMVIETFKHFEILI